MIQVHPQRAFLNSDVAIFNTGDQPALITDTATNDTYSLGPGEHKSSRYDAGEHILKVNGQEDVRFVVEDALKFGGSKRKKCYVFNENPWAIVVMKDRTYFLNEMTKAQFVEYNLSPDKILEINSDYLLFVTEKDCSFFSLSSMSLVKTISSAEFLFYKNYHCVFKVNNGLCLYRVHPGIGINPRRDIPCDAYSYDKGSNALYTHYGDDTFVQIIELWDHVNNGEYEHVTEVHPTGKFGGFSNGHYLLYTDSDLRDGAPNILKCRNLTLMNGLFKIIYHENQPLSYLNGIRVWDKNTYEEINNKRLREYISSGEGQRESFSVFVSDENIYSIRTRESIVIKEGECKTTITSCLFAGKNLLYTHSGSELFFKQKGECAYIVCGDSTYVIYEGGIYKVDGTLLFTNSDDPYVKIQSGNGVSYYTVKGEKINCQPDKSYPDLGMFFFGENGTAFFHWLKTGNNYVGQDVRREKTFFVVYGGLSSVPPRLFLKDGTIRTLPGSSVDIVALSQDAKTVLLEKGGYFLFARFDKAWNISEKLILSIYDTLNVKDAVFCSDGNSFIYQKENALVLYDINSGTKTVFSSNVGIQYNANGYRPYCPKDYFSRPRIIDPLTQRIIDNTFLNQYRFASIDGSAYYERSVTKRFLRDSDRELSNAEYLQLKQEYDFQADMDRATRAIILQKRTKYLKENRNVIINIFSLEYTCADFVDSCLVKDIEFVQLRANGKLVDVRIGSPLYFLNYVAFSPDSTKVIICGKYRDSSGVCVVYDIAEGKEIHHSIKDVGRTMAVWLGLFSKKGDLAYYDSKPNTYFAREGKPITKIPGRSFLTFSPSGKYMALSRQGYRPYNDEGLFWGHEPSCDVFIASTDNPTTDLGHYNDHGASITGLCLKHDTVASVSFSIDDKRILSVSNDGVVVVRNLHFE